MVEEALNIDMTVLFGNGGEGHDPHNLNSVNI
jgi:hypothetical protein